MFGVITIVIVGAPIGAAIIINMDNGVLTNTADMIAQGESTESTRRLNHITLRRKEEPCKCNSCILPFCYRQAKISLNVALQIY